MNPDSKGVTRNRVPAIALAPFLLITFGLTWGILALYILLPEVMAAIFGQMSGHHPLFILAVWTPAIAAFIVISYYAGLVGLRRYLLRMLLWRAPLAWYVFLVSIPLLFYCGAAIKGNLFTDPFPFTSLSALLSAFFIAFITGPIEEFGWRGLALPLLQRRFAPIWAALILGVIWGVWHLPAFLLSGTQQSGWSFTPFLVGSIALSLMVTPMFNASRGSILLPFLFHFQLINPIWPDAQPYDIFFFVAAALIIVLVNRKTMFRKAGAVTKVIPPKIQTKMAGKLTKKTTP
ncbi:type II CAAX endopeptidase family protein [Geitlerinema sp. PCC 9228]|jgi:hypothetical protein|uniref:CPBP family intramembrane glutamic endopeptidase n=1 Tax=Geitlerinema sp. PCC 9228 TaxID=111611 RepID=UPI0008F9C18F|nr:type II CAAX endopeptidase family protein [Geitlerinema sp. PCC 9228]